MLSGRTGTEPALARLLARRPERPVKWGLERILAMLEALARPERSFRSIHVAGTNGKGSVVAVADSILRRAGYRCGRYTSPHLCGFSERIAIDGEPAGADLLEASAARVLPLARRFDATFFEATTALAFDAFASAGLECAVVEVGLGGRLDATNIISSEVAVITSIDLDHSDYLGDDLGAIAREKAGILRANSPALIGPVAAPVLDVLLAQARDTGSAPEVFGVDFVASCLEQDDTGSTMLYSARSGRGPLRLRSPLAGGHQAANVALAIRAVDAFTEDGVSDSVIVEGLSSVNWPGRFQVERLGDGTWVYDMAHNPAAAEALAATVERADLPRPIVLLVSVLGDKDWTAVIRPLARGTKAVVMTVAPSAPAERAWDPALAARSLGGDPAAEVVHEFDAALARARTLAGTGTVLVSGSCHTVGDALRRNGRA